MVTDELLTTADALDIDVVKVSLFGGTGEALGASGEGEDGLIALGLGGDLLGLVQAHLGIAGSAHEHDDHEKDDDHGDGVESATVGGVDFHL